MPLIADYQVFMRWHQRWQQWHGFIQTTMLILFRCGRPAILYGRESKGWTIGSRRWTTKSRLRTAESKLWTICHGPDLRFLVPFGWCFVTLATHATALATRKCLVIRHEWHGGIGGKCKQRNRWNCLSEVRETGGKMFAFDVKSMK